MQTRYNGYSVWWRRLASTHGSANHHALAWCQCSPSADINAVHPPVYPACCRVKFTHCTLHLANTLINNISILSFLCDGDSHGVMWLRLQVKRLQQNVKSSTQEKRWTSQTGRDVHVCNHVQPFSRSPTCDGTDRQKYTMPLHIPRWQTASCDKNCKCEHYVTSQLKVIVTPEAHVEQ